MGFSLIVIVQVDLVEAARHLAGLDVDLIEEAEAVDAITRQLDLACVVPARFELPELAADHFVAGACVAGDVDAAHIDATLRLGGQRELHLPARAIDLGARVDLGEGIAEDAEAVDEGPCRLGHRLGAIRFAGPDRHQRLELVFACPR